MKKYLLFITAVILANGYFNSAASQDIFRGINCGTLLNFTSALRDTFSGDQEYTVISGMGYQGTNMETPAQDRFIGGAAGYDSLFHYRREGDFSYLFDVPNGTYAVTLFLSEKTYHWYDFRVMDVIVEGDTTAAGLDIFWETGRSYAWPVRVLTDCADGQINIDFPAGAGEACLSAVSVRSLSPDSSPPDPLSGFEIINGYEMNILYWDYIDTPDLAGYNVYRRSSGGTWQLMNPEPHPQYRYFDFDVLAGVESEYKITSIDFWGNESGDSEILSAIPVAMEATQLPRYLMEMTEENMYQLNIDVFSDEYVDADITLEGEYFPDSHVRYRGSDSRELDKKNFKLKLSAGDTHNGRHKFNTSSGATDPSLIRERLGYHCFDIIGLLNPFSQYVHMERNDEFIGVYTDLEQVEDCFLEVRGLSTSGNIYKIIGDLSILPSYEDYVTWYIKMNNEESDWYDIIDFVEWVNLSSPEEFFNESGSRFEVDDFLDMYCALITVASVDFVNDDFFMYYNPADGLWNTIQWDHNESFYEEDLPINLGTREEPLYGNHNYLLDKIMNNEVFRYSYCKKLERLMYNEFSETAMQMRVDSLYQEIEYDAMRDVRKKGWQYPDYFLSGPNSLYNFIEARIPFILSEIPGYITNPALSPYFRLNEIQSNNVSTIADEAGDYDPWIEIYNNAPAELDLDDFILHYGAQSWVLPEEAIVDGYGYLLVWLDGEPDEGPLHSTIGLAAASGTLWLEGRQGAVSDSVNYPALMADMVYARSEDGAGLWQESGTPTPGGTNTPFGNPFVLVINEFLAINDSLTADPFGDYDDWLEIYNTGNDEVELGGLYLTDDLEWPTRWVLPDTTIGSHEFMVVWCDNEVWQGSLHAAFKLSGGGEQIGFFNRDGESPIDTLTFGAQLSNVSFGRFPDGSDNWEFLYTPTLGSENIQVSVENRESPLLPADFELSECSPNPFNGISVIRFGAPVRSEVTLKVYDVSGREVSVLHRGKVNAGYYQAEIDLAEHSSGIYFCRMEADGFSSVKKVLLLK